MCILVSIILCLVFITRWLNAPKYTEHGHTVHGHTGHGRMEKSGLVPRL